MQYLDIFNRTYIEQSPVTGIVHPTDISYLRRLYVFNRDAIETYYRERNFSVKNTHILSRLVEHFPFFAGYDGYRYLDFANDKTKYLAKHFKFTSDIEKGIVHPPYFYGNDDEEIIFSNYNLFSLSDAEKNWKTIKPITVLKQNRNDSKLLLPLGNNDGSRSGLNVVSINIPLLSIKYRQFIKEQTTNELNNGVVLNKNNFVIKYVLSTMTEDNIDHMFLNKVMDRFYGREEVVPKFKHRFKIFEPTTQLERYVDNTIDVITSKKIEFINLLRNIQLVFKKDASELLCVDGLSGTVQDKWAIVASRIDYMIFLYDITPVKDMNRHFINDWSRLAKRVLSDNSINGMFSYAVEENLKEKLRQMSQW